MSDDKHGTLLLMARQRKEFLKRIEEQKKGLDRLDKDIAELIQGDIDRIFGSEKGKKAYGETTKVIGKCKVTIKVPRRSKYDNETNIQATQANELTWEEVNRFFKVKFDMTESGYNALQAAAMDSEKYSDVLSMVDDGREIIIGAPAISKIEILD